MVVPIGSRPMRSSSLFIYTVIPKLFGDSVFGLEKELKVALAGLPKTFDNCNRKQERKRKSMHCSNPGTLEKPSAQRE